VNIPDRIGFCNVFGHLSYFSFQLFSPLRLVRSPIAARRRSWAGTNVLFSASVARCQPNWNTAFYPNADRISFGRPHNARNMQDEKIRGSGLLVFLPQVRPVHPRLGRHSRITGTRWLAVGEADTAEIGSAGRYGYAG
jgi:hypothetical protein